MLTGAGELVTRDMEKIKVLNVFSASISTEECHWKAALYHLQKVMVTLAPDDWKKPNITSIFRKGKKEDPGDTVQSVYPQSPGRLWTSSFWKTCPHMKKKR